MPGFDGTGPGGLGPMTGGGRGFCNPASPLYGQGYGGYAPYAASPFAQPRAAWPTGGYMTGFGYPAYPAMRPFGGFGMGFGMGLGMGRGMGRGRGGGRGGGRGRGRW